jgi:HEAT repeat protein
MKLTGILFCAALAAATILPGAPRAGGELVPLKRAGGLGTLGSGSLERKSPAKERVAIGRDEQASGGLLEKKDPLVIITSPRAGEVSRSIQTISARVGGGIAKAFLRVNDDTSVVTLNSGEFVTEAALRPGLNTVTVLAWDLEGNLGKDFVQVFLSENTRAGAGVSIVEPVDGGYFDTTSDRVVTVHAELKGAKSGNGLLMVNGVRHILRFENGEARREIALMPGRNELLVEASLPDGSYATSTPVRVLTFDARPKDLVAVLTWDEPDADADLHVWDSFGHHTFNEATDPHLCEAAIPNARLDMDRTGGGGPEVFTLEAAEAEVYRFYASYNPGVKALPTNATMSLILHGDMPARRFMRVFGPIRIGTDAASWEAAIVKMPEGVFFQEKDQDLLKTLAMDSRAVKRLLLVLEEENPSFRLLAVTALGRIKSEEAADRLSEILLTDSLDMRRAAAGALWSISSVGSVMALSEALSDPDHSVRRTAAGALGHIGSPGGVRPLSTLLAEEGDPLVKAEAIRALGLIAEPGTAGSVLPLLRDPNPAIRVEAARALGNIRDLTLKNSEKELIRALDDEVPGVRELAAWALGETGGDMAVQPLMDLLYFDDSEGVRAQAALALGSLGAAASLPELQRAYLKDFSDRVRFCAGKAIEKISPDKPDETPSVPPPIVLDDDVVIY